MSTIETIVDGDYILGVDCPECGRSTSLPITLGAELKVTSEGGKLRATMATKRVEHNCSGEQVIPLFEGNGESPM
jgi:hypothetical protein